MSEVLFKHKNNHYSGTIKDGVVVFAPYGGGFVSQMSMADFTAKCEVVEALPKEVIYSWVNIDTNKPVLSYVNPHDRWNGWAQPSFELNYIKENLETIIGSWCNFERVKNGFNIASKDYPDEIEFCEDYDIIYEGKTITVNALCSGWCWDILTPKTALIYLIADQDGFGHKKDTTKETYKTIFRTAFPTHKSDDELTDIESKILSDAIESAKTV